VQPLLRVVDYAGYPVKNFNILAFYLFIFKKAHKSIFYEVVSILVGIIYATVQLIEVLPYYQPYYVTPLAYTYQLPAPLATSDENGYVQYGANGNPEFGLSQGGSLSPLLALALPLSMIHAMRMDSPLLRDEFANMDYGMLFEFFFAH
jgi:hypothetical protein